MKSFQPNVAVLIPAYNEEKVIVRTVRAALSSTYRKLRVIVIDDGSSDATGESPQDRPITPADLAATIYTLLGIDPQTLLHTADGRPVHVNRDGKVVQELVG